MPRLLKRNELLSRQGRLRIALVLFPAIFFILEIPSAFAQEDPLSARTTIALPDRAENRSAENPAAIRNSLEGRRPLLLFGSTAAGSISTVEHHIQAFPGQLSGSDLWLKERVEATSNKLVGMPFNLKANQSVGVLRPLTPIYALRPSQTLDEIRNWKPQLGLLPIPSQEELQSSIQEFRLKAKKSLDDIRATRSHFDFQDTQIEDGLSLKSLRPHLELPGRPEPEQIKIIPVDPESARAEKAIEDGTMQPNGVDSQTESFVRTKIEAELLRTKQSTPATISQEINAELLRGKRQATAEGAHAQTVFAQLRLPDNQKKEEVSGVLISWDEWHARFARLAEPEILRVLPAYNNAFGSNTVLITVQQDHHLSVELVKEGNPDFDAAIVAAYKSLSNNPELKFPDGSQRQKLSFQIDHEHVNSDPVNAVDSITGSDSEVPPATVP